MVQSVVDSVFYLGFTGLMTLTAQIGFPEPVTPATLIERKGNCWNPSKDRIVLKVAHKRMGEGIPTMKTFNGGCLPRFTRVPKWLPASVV
jgi:hypothetical protein